MIAFGPDTDVPPTPVQRLARRALVVGCTVLGLGVTSSIVHLSLAPVDAAVRPRIGTGDLSVMAAVPSAAAAVPTPAPAPPSVPAVRPSRTRWMLVTAYCPCPKCCGQNATGLTASGHPTTDNYGHFVAAPADLPFGTRLIVPGYNRNRPVPVYDRGGAIKGDRLDVFFPSHEKALAWGRRWVAVTIDGG